MTVSRANGSTYRAGLRGLVLAMLVAPAISGGLAAQQSAPPGPVRLAPPKAVEQPDRSITPSPARLLAAPALRSKEQKGGQTEKAVRGIGVQVDSLQAINADEAGVLTSESGALGTGLWKGAGRALVDKLLTELPVTAPSPVLRDLLSRLLLSPAREPDGSDKTDGSLIEKRVRLLLAMSNLRGAEQLLNALPTQARTGALLEAESDLRLLAGDHARACSLATREMPIRPTAYWQKVFVICQVIDGERDKAALSVSLMRELGEADETYLLLADALTAGVEIELKSLPSPDPLLMAMARIAKVDLPGDALASNQPAVLNAIATSPNVSKGMRLEAAERADASGALPIEVLRQLYTSVDFSQADLANPLSRAEVEFGPMVRALLYHASLVQTLPVAQAEAVQRAFDLARQEGRYGSMAKIFQPVLRRIPPSSDLLWFAPEAIRAFIAAGNSDRARPWTELLSGQALINPAHADTVARLQPVVWFSQAEPDKQPAEFLEAWWRAVEKDDGARERAVHLYSLLEAFGVDVGRANWEPLVGTGPRTAVTLPDPGLWRRLLALTETDAPPAEPATPPAVAEAPVETFRATSLAATGSDLASVVTASPLAEPVSGNARTGEAILLALHVIGERGTDRVGPFVLKGVLQALQAVDLEKEARQLALESLLAAGI